MVTTFKVMESRTNEDNNFMYSVVVYFLITLLFLILWTYYLHKRRQKKAAVYPMLLKSFNVALAQNNVDEIIDIGNKLVWNENFSIEHKKYVYKELNERVNKYPQLIPLWRQAYFERFGVYPE